MTCPRCGMAIPEGSQVCPACGLQIQAGQQYQAAAPRNNNFLWWIFAAVFFVCVSCTGILAAVLFPVFSQAKLAARAALVLSRAKQVGVAEEMYLNDGDGKFPAVTSVAQADELFDKYITSSIPIRGATGKIPTDFVWNSQLAGHYEDALTDPANVWLCHSGKVGTKYAVAYTDGHAKLLDQVQFDEAMKVQAGFDAKQEADEAKGTAK